MKNIRGISLIALIVTIIVLIIISSITIYTGGNMMNQARIKNANDRLQTVANAIASHEEELGFANTVVGGTSGEYRLLGSDDYEIMGLDDYKNDEQMPPIYILKTADENSNKREYHLKTPTTIKKNANYEEDDFVSLTHTFYDTYNRKNLMVEFDSIKGVNRPILTADMMPVHTYFDKDENVYSEPVKDIYTEDWYDYSAASPKWANVKMNDNFYYVWIPRFAYKIEDFYVGTDYSNIPSSAIKIVFLKENTDYMANDEVLPAGYRVHPAFKYAHNDVETNIPGFWVAKYNVNNLVDVVYKVEGEGTAILGALENVELDNLHVSGDELDKLESHLLKNTEWAAIAYLSFATSGKTDDGSSLGNNPSSVMDLNVRTFVAGVYKGTMKAELEKNFDIYDIDDQGKLFYISSEDEESGDTVEFGDAIFATSSGTSINSSWFAGRSIKITEEAPFIIRGVDNCIFSYAADTRSPVRGAACRNVLLIDAN